VLGITDGAAPVGGWVAVTGSLDLVAILLGATVAFWVGGFDIIYACQDVDFDQANNLHSIPSRFGMVAAFWAARVWHAIALACLASAGALLGLNAIFWVGWVLAGLLLVYEHRLVSPRDLSRLDMAFFNVNGYLALGVFAFTFAAVLVR